MTPARDPSDRRLRGLIEITRLAAEQTDIAAMLDGIAAQVAETAGFAGVVVNVFRPAQDDFQAATVVGAPEMREQLLGATYARNWWEDKVLDPRFLRRQGAYFIPEGALDWDAEEGPRYLPPLPADGNTAAWHAGDELFVPCRDVSGAILAILSFGQPRSALRPGDGELDLLVAVGRHTARALEQARRAVDAQRHRDALERLLGAASRLVAAGSPEHVLAEACAAIGQAFGFRAVRADAGAEAPAGMGGEAWRIVPEPEAGMRAWRDHEVVLVLRDAQERVLGCLRAGDPEDGLLPSTAQLQALALFAGQVGLALTVVETMGRLRVQADEDPLTGLLNRRAFTRELDAALAAPAGEDAGAGPVSLVLLDLDHFKALNDRLGHPAGDAVLRTVAGALRAAVRAGDLAFRLGGDEFALLLRGAGEADAAAVARRAHAFMRDGTPVQARGVGISSGWATAGAGEDAEALVRRADTALYAAKAAGRTPAT